MIKSSIARQPIICLAGKAKHVFRFVELLANKWGERTIKEMVEK